MPPPLPAHVQVQLDLQEETVALDRAASMARALAATMTDPSTVRMIEQQNKALKDQAKFAESAARERRRIEVGARIEEFEHGAPKFAVQMAATEKAREEAQKLAAAYESPAGLTMIKKQQEATKQLAKEQEAAARAKRRVEVGGLAEGLENASKKLGGLQAGLNNIAYKSAVVFAGIAVGIRSAASVADTGTGIATLTTSFTLLSQSVGEAFLPMIQDASRWIQRAANWVRDLDSATKGNIARVIVWTAGIAGTIMVGAKFGAMIVGLVKTISAFGTFLSSSAMAMNPWLVGLAALATVLVAATGNMGNLKDAAVTTFSKVGAGLSFLGANLGSLLSGEGFTGMKEWADKQVGMEGIKRQNEYTEQRLGTNLLQGKAERGEFGAGAKEWFEKNKALELADLKGLEKVLPDDQKGILEQLRKYQTIHKEIFPNAGKDDLLMAQRGMPQPGFFTGEGLGEAAQLRSLEMEAGGSAEAELMKRQLEASERHNGELMKKLDDLIRDAAQRWPPAFTQ